MIKELKKRIEYLQERIEEPYQDKEIKQEMYEMLELLQKLYEALTSY